MNKVLAITLFVASAISANAQARWSASAVTAVPHMSGAGTLNLQTYDFNAHGRGIRTTFAFLGTTYGYVPVTANNGEMFRLLHLRAEDNSPFGAVLAEFIRQPRDAVAGPAVVLATVGTINAGGDGFQFRTVAFAAETIDLNRYSYYIRITLRRSLTAATPTAYDVSLSL